MSDSSSGTIDVGPPRRNADNWKLAPRPAENLDAAQVTIIAGPNEGNGNGHSNGVEPDSRH